MGRNKHEYISAGRFMEIEKFDVCPGDFDSVDELADEDAISDEERVLHGAGRDFERFDNKGADEPKNKHKSNDRNLNVFPNNGVLEFLPAACLLGYVILGRVHECMTSNPDENIESE